MTYLEAFLQSHSGCYAWCKPAEGIHAMIGWYNPASGETDPQPAAQRTLSRFFGAGTKILEMRLAPEAVVPTADDLEGYDQIDDRGRRRAAIAPAVHEVAYLTMVQITARLQTALAAQQEAAE